ncbi:uncharacterized protein LOC111108565 [Crassostrea virginica]
METKWNSTKQGDLWPCLRKQSCKISIKRRRDVVCFCRKHNCARVHCNKTIKEKPKTRSVLMLNKCSETSKKDNIRKEDKIHITEISDHEARTSIEFEDTSVSNSLDTYKDILDILESSSGCFFPMMKRKISAVFCVSRKPIDDCFVIKCPCKRKPNPKEKNWKPHSRRVPVLISSGIVLFACVTGFLIGACFKQRNAEVRTQRERNDPTLAAEKKEENKQKTEMVGTGDARGLITSDVNALDDTYHNICDVLQANYEGNRNFHPDVDFEETKL